MNNAYSELVGLIERKGNEQGINVKEAAFCKIKVQMLLYVVSLCFDINAYLLQESKIAFLISSTSMLLRRHRAFSAKMRAKLHNLVPAYDGKHLHHRSLLKED